MQKACKRNNFEVGKMLMKEKGFNYENIYGDEKEQEKPQDRKDKKYKYNDKEASYHHICAFYGSKEMLEALITEQSKYVNQKDSKGNTPLHLASKNGNITCVVLLLQHGANVNERNKGLNTPLHLASLHGCTTCVSHLIEKGAQIDETNSKRCTPLLLAIYNAREELVYKLICGGADVNAIDSQGRTPLHIAAQRGRDVLVPVLINNGADINSKTPDEQLTPLMMACKAGSAACGKELIFRGASVNEKDRDRDDAFAIARNEKQDEALSLVARALRGSKNFKLFDWHKVIDNKLYKSTLTMLDCLIRPEMDKNSVKLDFRPLEMDSHTVTPGKEDDLEYKKGGRRNPYLLQKFSMCDNEEIAHHGVTRILVNQKFKQFGRMFLWTKTIWYVTFLATMLFALVQAARYHETLQTLYHGAMSERDIWRCICEVYVVLFWLGDIVVEIAEVFQVFLFARNYPCDKKKEQRENVSARGRGKTIMDVESKQGGRKGSASSTRVSCLYENPISSRGAPFESMHENDEEIREENLGGDDEPPVENQSLDYEEGPWAKSGYFDDYDFDLDTEMSKPEDPAVSINNNNKNTLPRGQSGFSISEEPSMIEELKIILKKFKSVLQENLFVRVLKFYFHDWYNWIDIAGLLSVFILIIYRLIIIINPHVRYLEFQWLFATFAFAINAFRLIKLLNVFEIFGTYMRIIVLILCEDVPKFLLLLLLTIVFFSSTLYFSYRVPVILNTNGTNGTVDYYDTLFDLDKLNHSGLNQYSYTLLYPLRILLEGNTFEFNYLFDSFNVVAAAVYSIFLFLIIVVYLNLFIAQLSDTYVSAKANAEKTVAKIRLDYIVQIETTSFLSLFIDFRKRYYEPFYIMEDGKWIKYFKASISLLDDDDFMSQEPQENLHTLLNKVQKQQQQQVNNQKLQSDIDSIKDTIQKVLEKLGNQS